MTKLKQKSNCRDVLGFEEGFSKGYERGFIDGCFDGYIEYGDEIRSKTIDDIFTEGYNAGLEDGEMESKRRNKQSARRGSHSTKSK